MSSIIAHMWLDGGWGVLAGLLWAAFWVGVVVLVIALARGISRERHGAPTSALRLLEERYARGEIDREEFHQRRSVLARHGVPD